jgi:hypothetical protein
MIENIIQNMFLVLFVVIILKRFVIMLLVRVMILVAFVVISFYLRQFAPICYYVPPSVGTTAGSYFSRGREIMSINNTQSKQTKKI